MSDFPPPPPPPGYGPVSYAGPQMSFPSPRPTVVTVLAIIGIVWSSLALLASLGGLAFLPTLLHGKKIFGQPLVPLPTGWVIYTILSSIVAIALAGLLLGASIVALRLTPWGRRGMLWWAAAQIVVMIISMAVQLSGADPQTAALRANQQRQFGQMGNTPAMQNKMRIVQYSGNIAGVFCGGVLLIYPIWILATFTKPYVTLAFEKPTA